MVLLSDFSFKPDYNKSIDDIANSFYLPCMHASFKYDRITGYFGSTVYIIAWPALKGFVKRGGRMRVICAPTLMDEDKLALEEGYAARESATLVNGLRKEIARMFESEYLEKPSRALACLVAMNVVNIKIAIVGSEALPHYHRLFHDKIGLFYDVAGNAVGFRGSMNETYKGLASDGNIESIDVFTSWHENRDAQRVKNAAKYFESLWNNEVPGVSVFDIPQVVLDELTRNVTEDQWEVLTDQVCYSLDKSVFWTADPAGHIKPRSYQVQALEEWCKRGRRGIFAHATGSGKTFTALCAVRKALLDNDETPFIIVPSRELLYQWQAEIKRFLSDIKPLILMCGDKYTDWKANGLLSAWSKPTKDPRIILATADTASRSDFATNLVQGEHLFIVADEVHRLGSPIRRNVLNFLTGARLGLSATPKRYGDPEGTRAIFDYFGEIVPPVFSLQDAIKEGALCKYYYYPHAVRLTPDEQNDYDELSRRISTLIARHSPDSLTKIMSNDSYLKMLLIRRARIIKNSAAKLGLALRVVEECWGDRQRWIVYCDNLDQLRRISDLLRSQDYNVLEYYSGMPGDRKETIKYFEKVGGILLSIKCLDEGVNIPAATHALILASSKNPREFIQRRGRILRKSPGKTLAYLHDAIVLPSEVAVQESSTIAILSGELSRAIEFGQWAENPSCVAELKALAIEYGIDTSSLIEGGYELDEE